MKQLLILFILLAVPVAPAGAFDFVNVGDGPKQSYQKTENPPPDHDSSWEPFTNTLAEEGATLWLVQEVEIRRASGEEIHNPLTFAVRLNGVYDFYWDGEYLGSNTHLGHSAPQFSRIIVPIKGLSEGRHKLAVRISAPGLRAGDNLGLNISRAAVQTSFFGVHPSVISTFFVATASLVVSLYLVVIWRSGRPQKAIGPALLISMLSGAIILLEEGPHLFSYSYLTQLKLDNLLTVAAMIMLLVLPWYIFAQLGLKQKSRWMLIAPLSFGLGLIETSLLQQDVQTFFILSALLVLVTLYRWRSSPDESKFFSFFLGLAAIAILLPYGTHWFLMALVVMLAARVALDIRSQAQEAFESAVRAERLGADLIKRSIQPHFLMNSLTALMEWVETTPDIAVDFIEGLAKEFRLLSAFAEQKSVTLQEEGELCITHANLMAMRLEAELSVKIITDRKDHLVPPALFHTLLENAFSHNNYAGKTAEFLIRVEDQPGYRLMSFSCPVGQETKRLMGSGTGSKYLQARLKEFCGNGFTFQSEQVGSNWVTTITVPDAA